MLDAFHDGEHDPRGARPRGALRFIQHVNTDTDCWAMCEVGPHTHRWPATSLHQDGYGNGWLMCPSCVCEYLGMERDAD